ncbi:MAG: aspartyl protease [Crenarchaeota archaeon]|nr:aspartyl protease [Thermoproteota archaeon]
MGIICIRVKICNLDRSKCVETDAIVDTGSTLSVIPRNIARDLELKAVRIDKVRTGAGTVELEAAAAVIEVLGKQTLNDVWISDTIDTVLIGAVTLECLGLRVDPVTGRLVESFKMMYKAVRTLASS